MTILDKETRPLAMLLGGFLLWAVAFLVIYMTQATGCRLGWNEIGVFGMMTMQRSVLVALYLLAFATHLYLIVIFGRSDARGQRAFPHQAGQTLAFAALASSLFCFAGVFWLTTC